MLVVDVIIYLFILFIPFIKTKTVYVTKSTTDLTNNGSDEYYPNIRFALESISNGDTIRILPGVYSGPNNTNLCIDLMESFTSGNYQNYCPSAFSIIGSDASTVIIAGTSWVNFVRFICSFACYLRIILLILLESNCTRYIAS